MSSLELVMMRRINELNEEVRRLNEDVKRLAADSIKDMSHIAELTDELERLRASSFVTAVPSEHYERVIKAGDAMAKNLSHINWNICVEEWNAAKEGKQS